MPQASDEFTARFPTGVESCPTILVGKTATWDGSARLAGSISVVLDAYKDQVATAGRQAGPVSGY